MSGASDADEAIAMSNDNPGHLDPSRMAVFFGGAVFLGTFVSLNYFFPEIGIGRSLVLPFPPSILAMIVLYKRIRAFQLKRDAKHFEVKREENRVRTEKAIAEMKKRED